MRISGRVLLRLEQRVKVPETAATLWLLISNDQPFIANPSGTNIYH